MPVLCAAWLLAGAKIEPVVAESAGVPRAAPAVPDIERVLADGAPFGEIVVTHAAPRTVRRAGTLVTEPAVGVWSADGFVRDGQLTLSYVPAKKSTPARWKISAKSTGPGAESFAVTAFVGVDDGAVSGVVVRAKRRGEKAVTRKGVPLSLVLASDNPRPARLDSGFFMKLSTPVGASMARAHEVRLMDDGRTFVVAGTAVFPGDNTPTNCRPCAWIVLVGDDGTIDETFVPLWGELGTEGEARCVGPNGDIGGALRTANADPDYDTGMPCVWSRSDLAFSANEIFDSFPETDVGSVHAFTAAGIAGETAAKPFEGNVTGPAVLKSEEVNGFVLDCSSVGRIQVGFLSAGPVRWVGSSAVALRHGGGGVALGCSNSGNWASGKDDELACVWDARGRVTRLTAAGAPFTGITSVITDAGQSWGSRFDGADRVGLGDGQHLPSSVFVRPVGSADVLDWSGYLGTLTGTEWLSGHEAAPSGEIPEAFLGGDTRRSTWGQALTGWTSADRAFVLWVPKR